MNFGGLLAKYRKRLKMSRPELSEASGVHRVNIWQLETGKVGNPSVNTVLVLARALDIPPHDIFYMDLD